MIFGNSLSQKLATAGMVLILALTAQGAQAQVSFFKASSDQPRMAGDLLPNAAALRQRLAIAEPQVVSDLVTTSPGGRIVFDMFDDARFLVSLDKQQGPVTTSSKTWVGKVLGHPLATFNMAVVGEATAADLKMPDGITYSIRYRGNGIHEIQEISEAALPECGNTDAHLVTTETLMRDRQSGLVNHTPDIVASADGANQVDVLIAYTQGAETMAGGPSGMTSQINLAFSHANTTYANSQIDLTLYNVGSMKVTYTEAASMSTDLARLQNTGDGFMDEVTAMRETVRADMVCLFRAPSITECGVGYIMNPSAINQFMAPYAISVVGVDCISGHTFAHELGHNMGCAHELPRAAGSNPAYPYSFGYIWTGLSTNVYRSIMAYARDFPLSPGTRVQHFSNPSVLHDGVATGNVSTANNALTINNTRGIVANFRQRIAPSLAVSEEPITMKTRQGHNGTKAITVGNSGIGTANYTLTENAAWATISPTSGAAAATVMNPHTFTLNTSALALGPHNATLTITDAGSNNSPKTVPMNLTVTPANDDFAFAETISGLAGSVAVVTSHSTREAGEPATIGEFAAVGQRSVWYKWQAPSSAQVQFQTGSSSFDTIIGVYTGALGSLVLIGHNDEGPGIGHDSRVTFIPTASTNYNILIDGWDGGNGTTTLQWATDSSVTEWSLF